MVIERVNRPESQPRGPMTSADKTRAIIMFAAIEMVGVVALSIFLMGFFVLDWFPNQPTPVLAGALVAFAVYVLFAMWLSGLLAMIFAGKTDAGR